MIQLSYWTRSRSDQQNKYWRGSRLACFPNLIMYKYIFLFLIAFTILCCQEEDLDDMKVTYFEQGRETDINFRSKAELEQLQDLITDLIAGTNDVLRLLVNNERVEQIKNENNGIEIKFSELIIIHSNELADYQVDGLLIPFTGEFADTDENGVATVFLADEVYVSGPLRNPSGMKLVNQIEVLLEKIQNK